MTDNPNEKSNITSQITTEMNETKYREMMKMLGNLRGEIDKGTAATKEQNKEATALGKTYEGLTGKAQKFGDKLKGMYEGGAAQVKIFEQRVSQAGIASSRLANLIQAPIKEMMADYEKFASLNDPVLQQWKETTNEIYNSTKEIKVELGRAFTQAMQPYQEKLAVMLNDLTKFMDAHPEVVDAVAKIGVGILAVTTIVTTAASILEAATLFAGAAQTLGAILTTVAGGIVAAIGGGAVLGGLGANAIAKTEFGQKLGMANTNQAAVAGIYTLNKALGATEEEAKDAVKMYLILTGQMEKTNEALGDLVDGIISKNADLRSAAIIYSKAREDQAEADKKYVDAVKEITANTKDAIEALIRTTNAAMNNARKTYEANVTKIWKGLIDSTKKENESYAETIADITSSMNEGVQQAETSYMETRKSLMENYYKSLEALEKQRQEGVDSAIASRDALALWRAQHEFNEGKKELDKGLKEDLKAAKESHRAQLIELKKSGNDQLAEAKKNHDKVLVDLEKAAKNQVTALQKGYNEQVKTISDGMSEQRKKIMDNQAKQLRDLADQYRKEQTARDKALKDQLMRLEGFYEKEKKATEAHYKDMEALMVQHFKNETGLLNSTGTTPKLPTTSYGTKASGGYANYGIYKMAEQGREFVLDNPTTMLLERAIGGLNQAKIQSLSYGDSRLGSLSRGGKNGAVVNSRQIALNQNFTFHGSFTDGDKQWFRDAAREQALEAFAESVGA